MRAYMSKQINRLMRKVESIETKAGELALKEVVRMARQIMRSHPEIKEFVMGMGGWHFSYGDPSFRCPNENYMKFSKRLAKFIEKWDDRFQLTGCPMRFTADGEIRHDW